MQVGDDTFRLLRFPSNTITTFNPQLSMFLILAIIWSTYNLLSTKLESMKSSVTVYNALCSHPEASIATRLFAKSLKCCFFVIVSKFFNKSFIPIFSSMWLDCSYCNHTSVHSISTSLDLVFDLKFECCQLSNFIRKLTQQQKKIEI